MESFIKAENNGKNICMVFAHNDDMAIGAIQAIKEAGLKPGKDILTGSIDGVPDIYKAMIAGEANASVELAPNMAGPAFDALEKYKKDGTLPEKLTITKSTLYLPDTAKEELEKKKKYGLLSGEPLIPSLSPMGEGKKQRSRNPGKPSATRGNLTSFEGDIDYERRGTLGDPSHRRT
ncbi:periplasmic binding protein/LacI transcriptional regulator [Klebsiella pneumoniae]|uniref:Periplasmic binding protein/LacI transcriptional regulator n=1 Tax=Klebsiella pneumoniae TaxID=573 RepID=A0A377XJN5_KLEPN|nr:periplasmic binding protein/LacI transcriptional regulator [Klebsiella pneumoniae]